MISLLPDYQATDNRFIQPQTQRYHFPFRGSRDSEKLNLIMSQLAFDLVTLYTAGLSSDNELNVLFNTIINISSTSIPIALGYTDAIVGGDLYDLDNQNIILGGDPFDSFTYTIQGGDSTTLSALFDTIAGMETLSGELEGFMKRLDILEGGL